jgi:hypothetical protein
VDIYPDTLAYAKWDVTADVDLASATATVNLADAEHDLTWTGAAVHTGSTWTRTGQLLVSGANPATGVKPTADDRRPLVTVTVGGEVIPQASTLRFNLR